MDSRSECSTSKIDGDDVAVTGAELCSNTRCLDEPKLVVRLREDANGYFSVHRESVQTSVQTLVRTQRNLPSRAEDEIMRIRYFNIKGDVKRLNGARLVKPKRRKLDGKVMFTTLEEVMREAKDGLFPVEVTRQDGAVRIDGIGVETDDELFLQVLREIDEKDRMR